MDGADLARIHAKAGRSAMGLCKEMELQGFRAGLSQGLGLELFVEGAMCQARTAFMLGLG